MERYFLDNYAYTFVGRFALFRNLGYESSLYSFVSRNVRTSENTVKTSCFLTLVENLP